MKPRLVIDTNVFVSGLISPDAFPGRVLQTVRLGRAVHLVSDPIIEEYLRVLRYPRIRRFPKITDDFMIQIAAYLIYRTERVEVVSTIKRSPDPDDDIFLATAVDGDATLLVSGDKADLLSLGHIEGIPIVSPREAVRILQRS